MLLIDAGNTRIKWALAAPASQPGAWQETGAVLREEVSALEAAWRGKPVSRVLLSNVAGAAVRSALDAVLARCFEGSALQVEDFRSQAARAGLRNRYRNPGQLGSDRFASSIGAHTLYPGQALVVVTCGTATTIDAITADGVFTGGMILPGLRLMAAALANHTAQLPQVAERMQPGQSFADNTEEAIVLGCLSAQAGAIERALALLPGARCIISGGAGRMVARFIGNTPEFVENLVLVGLHAAALEKDS
ncbi:MAG: pantothenate kinase [Paucimonas sp.]|nr:pantothenate kinase [Paucimonas sp.]